VLTSCLLEWGSLHLGRGHGVGERENDDV